jgi:hypothetical protein
MAKSGALQIGISSTIPSNNISALNAPANSLVFSTTISQILIPSCVIIF